MTVEEFEVSYTINLRTGCWEWDRARSHGYGVVRIAGKNVPAHRFAYELWVGPIPGGMFLCHSCDNPLCIRPAHLEPGDQKKNMSDAASRGRTASGCRNGSRTRPDRVARGERKMKKRLTAQDIPPIFALRQEGWTQAQIAIRFHVARSTVRHVLLRHSWRHVDPFQPVMSVAANSVLASQALSCSNT